jgi:hypothetical protein
MRKEFADGIVVTIVDGSRRYESSGRQFVGADIQKSPST